MSETTSLPLGELGPVAHFKRMDAMKEAQRFLMFGKGKTMTKEERRYAVTRETWDKFLPASRTSLYLTEIAEAQREWLLTQPEKVDDEGNPLTVENRCAKCDDIIPRTGQRGRPAKHCDDCKASEVKPLKLNICSVCEEMIPKTGKRGRQPSKHEHCR